VGSGSSTSRCGLPFIKLHKLCSYLVAVTGVLILLLPNILLPITWPIVLIAVIVSWFYEGERLHEERYRRRWTSFTAVVFFGSLFLLLLRIIQNPIQLACYLLLFLLVNKLFNRRTNRDYLHIYLLSFLMLTLSTILNSELSYAVCFVMYVVFLTWTLTLFHLRREIEETYLMRHAENSREGEKVDVEQILQSRRLVRGSFLFSTSLIALAIFASSGLLFVLFPRVGFGLFFHRQRRGPQMAGFSNQVDLGSFGSIRQNRQVVLRVELPEQSIKKRLTYYWRGMSFDKYDGKRWTRSEKKLKLARWVMPWHVLLQHPFKMDKDSSVRQIIYREPLSTDVLFAIDQVSAFRLPHRIQEKVRFQIPRVHYDRWSGVTSYKGLGRTGSAFRYEAYSFPTKRRRAMTFRALRGERAELEATLRRLYTQRPSGIDERILALAQRVTRNVQGQHERAMAILRYLRKNYTYSLQRAPFKGRPLPNFLFVQKRGHCEFFSTSMIMLLRSLGVPARQVTGFHGGEWNQYGQYYAVRQSHAHSWVEVYDQKGGWRRYDPTPSGRPQQRWAIWSQIEQRIDALKLRWQKWVIEYDLSYQISALLYLRKVWRAGGSEPVERTASSKPSVPYTRVLLICLGAAVLFFLIFMVRRRRAAGLMSSFISPATLLYVRALELLQGEGLRRCESETPSEFFERVAGERPELREAFSHVTQHYLEFRYAARSEPESFRSALLDGIVELERCVREDAPT